MQNNFTDASINLSDRVIRYPKFSIVSKKKIKLSDYVVIYNNGYNWKGVSLKIMRQYPVIHDLYLSDNPELEKETAVKISIVVCPYTLFSCVYFGEYIPNNKVFNNNIILDNINEKGQYLIPILNNLYNIGNDKPLDYIVKREEIRIMTLRNALSTYTDILLLDNEEIKSKEMIVPENYFDTDEIIYKIFDYSKKYHPKQIVYIIEYKSSSTADLFKKTVIIPKENNLDVRSNGFKDYYDKMALEIRDRGGIVYNCLWFAWNAIYPDSKVIEL